MPDVFACPFCLGAVPRPGDAGRRVVCPRCGESVLPSDDVPAEPTDPLPGDPPEPTRALLSLLVLGVGLGLVVLTIGLYGIFGAKPEPRRPKPPPAAEAAQSAAPLDEPLLKYAPAAATVVFVARPNANPDTLAKLESASLPDSVLQTLAEVGLPISDLSTLAGGLILEPGTLIPRGVIAITWLRPGPGPGPGGLNVVGEPEPGHPGVVRVRVRELPLFVRVVDRRTLLLASEAADLTLPPPRSGGHHLSASVQNAVARVPAGSTAWLATAQADWEQVPAVALGWKLWEQRGGQPATKLGAVVALWAAFPETGPVLVETQDRIGAWTRLQPD